MQSQLESALYISCSFLYKVILVLHHVGAPHESLNCCQTLGPKQLTQINQFSAGVSRERSFAGTLLLERKDMIGSACSLHSASLCPAFVQYIRLSQVFF